MAAFVGHSENARAVTAVIVSPEYARLRAARDETRYLRQQLCLYRPARYRRFWPARSFDRVHDCRRSNKGRRRQGRVIAFATACCESQQQEHNRDWRCTNDHEILFQIDALGLALRVPSQKLARYVTQHGVGVLLTHAVFSQRGQSHRC